MTVVALTGLAGVLVLSACTSGTGQGTGASGGAEPATGSASQVATTTPVTPAPAPAADAIITTSPTKHTAISPATPVSVAVADGTLTTVKMVNSAGKSVTGTLASDGTSWHATEALGYNKTYTLSAEAVNADGKKTSTTEKLSTLSPDNMTMPTIQRIGGYALTKNATYGVAIVPVVHFDEPITNKAAAQKALSVTTSPHVDGSWYWADDQNAHFRPQTYWPAGTKVTVKANVYGVKVGPGLYGQADVSTSFKIGRKQVTIAYDTAPKSVNKVRVYNAAGKVIRTMNTSMGTHGGTTVGSSYINFYTLNGTYTVLDHEQPAKMCSATYGLPANAPGGYPCEDIYNATKISTDGIYLHLLNSTVWDQNNGYDVSHGCLNLNPANSMWFFKHSIVGDPVQIHGAKGAPTLQVWEGGDWTVPWKTWLAGSAIT